MAMSSAAFAQQARAVTPVSDYVKYLLQPTPEFEETWGQLTGLISDECAKVMKASPDELEKEKRWLNGITRDAKIRLERAFDRVEHLAHIHRTAGQAEIPQEAYNSIQSDLADARLEVAVTALINARVGECITTRGRTLGGEYWMTGSWQARCTAAPGVEPDTYGRLTLQLAGKTVRGTVFPGADSPGQWGRTAVLKRKAGQTQNGSSWYPDESTAPHPFGDPARSW
jgi:hypothetical protein